EYLKCKACGSYSMVPVEVEVEHDESDELLSTEEDESRFYSCHVCGDNWLSVRHVESDGQCQLTFVHQMGVNPTLKRIAQMQTHIVMNKDTVEEWSYFVGDDRIEEGEWFDRLDARRRTLKAICSN
ncbi:MAG: hypothetical protein AAGI08_13685, partial [Bacteroidota bacterium]